ncbi:MAG: hypothetical protein KF775_11450 [Cyclobacteriaceae bacterium]|nr:hypothetical protein [Cyclobacteriaceae bacterium]
MSGSIYSAFQEQVIYLQELLANLSDSDYSYPAQFLSKGTIGQHTRHVIELAQCLAAGYDAGIVNYDNRPRSLQLETDRTAATEALRDLVTNLNFSDKPMLLVVGFPQSHRVSTTYFRELTYNVEHAIHHMALIRVALVELQRNIVTPGFGVAYATQLFRKSG